MSEKFKRYTEKVKTWVKFEDELPHAGLSIAQPKLNGNTLRLHYTAGKTSKNDELIVERRIYPWMVIRVRYKNIPRIKVKCH